MLKILLYIIIFPIIAYSVDGININQIFKKNKIVQAKIIYIAIIFSLSYLVVNFIYDFVVTTNH